MPQDLNQRQMTDYLHREVSLAQTRLGQAVMAAQRARTLDELVRVLSNRPSVKPHLRSILAQSISRLSQTAQRQAAHLLDVQADELAALAPAERLRRAEQLWNTQWRFLQGYLPQASSRARELLREVAVQAWTPPQAGDASDRRQRPSP